MATSRLSRVSRRAVDLAHPALAEQAADFVGPEGRAGERGPSEEAAASLTRPLKPVARSP